MIGICCIAQLKIVEGGWDQYAPNEKPSTAIRNWDNKLTVFLTEMHRLNQRTEIIGKAGVYNQIHQNIYWNVDVMTAKSFVNITKTGLALQFERAIMEPYEKMLSDGMGDGTSNAVSVQSPGVMMEDPFNADYDPIVEDPTNESWSNRYLIHYYDLVTVLMAALVALCAVNLFVTSHFVVNVSSHFVVHAIQTLYFFVSEITI